MFTISILNLKGGVSKTTTSVNMAFLLAQRGHRVLLIDNDKQGNSSKAFRRYDPEDESTSARMLTDPDGGVAELVKETSCTGLDIITANMNLLTANMKTMLDIGSQQQTRYRKALEPAMGCYDYCIIDNAPDINMSVINGLGTAAK